MTLSLSILLTVHLFNKLDETRHCEEAEEIPSLVIASPGRRSGRSNLILDCFVGLSALLAMTCFGILGKLNYYQSC